MTPFPALAPYILAAAASLSTVIDLISFPLILDKSLPSKVGTPSITYKGLPAVKTAGSPNIVVVPERLVDPTPSPKAEPTPLIITCGTA